MVEELKPSYNFSDARLNELKSMFPEAFEDGVFNIDTLKELIGDYSTENNVKEHFGLNWVGKIDARRMAAKSPTGTLKMVQGKGINESTTQNVFIEGENLEVLKILRNSYAGKIKMIYIDPPYNTGNDFVYKDDFSDSTEDYLKKSGERSEDSLLVSNPKTSGRYHANWLSFMYPRLRIAKDLLSENGLIFVSIDDNECENTKLLLNEIFGEENFLAQLVWHSEGNTDNQLEIKNTHEYILLYCKDIENKSLAIGRVIDPNTREDSNLRKGFADNNINKNSPANPPTTIELPVGFPSDASEFTYQKRTLDDEFFEITKKEKYISDKVKNKYNLASKSGLPVKIDDMIVKDFKLVEKCKIYGGFANGNKLKAFIENGMQPITDEDGSPIRFYLNRNAAVRYRKDVDQPRNIISVLKNLGTTEKTKTELKNIGVFFSYPKPVGLIKYLVSIGAQEEDCIVLDFFGGSGTTAQAVIEANNQDHLNRKFILIQVPEKCNPESEAFKAGFNNVSEISLLRIKKVIEENIKENSNLLNGNVDYGFKMYCHERSNIYKWVDFDPSKSGGVVELNNQLKFALNNPIKEGVDAKDVLTEIILLKGFPLNSKIETISDSIFKISDDYISFDLYVSIGEKLTARELSAIKLRDIDHFVCFDNAFENDTQKQNLENCCKLFTI